MRAVAVSKGGTLARKVLRDLPASVSLLVLVALVLTAIVALFTTPRDPLELNLSERFKPPFINSAHPLGTDDLGRDVLSRVMVGIRISMMVAVPTCAIGLVVGTLLGLWAGFKGGAVDAYLMRAVDMANATPLLVVAIAILALFGGGLRNLILTLSLFTWTGYARVVRGQTLVIKEQDFVAASRTIGATPARIVLRHILPHALPIVIVIASFQLPQLVLTESSLSFLGLGIQPRVPSLGNMIAGGRGLMDYAWWLVGVPAICLALIVISFNTLGDYLRDHADPRLRGVR